MKVTPEINVDDDSDIVEVKEEENDEKIKIEKEKIADKIETKQNEQANKEEDGLPKIDLLLEGTKSKKKRKRESTGEDQMRVKKFKMQNSTVLIKDVKIKKKRRSKKNPEMRKIMKKLLKRERKYQNGRQNDHIFKKAGISLDTKRNEKTFECIFSGKPDEHHSHMKATFCKPGDTPKTKKPVQAKVNPTSNDNAKNYMIRNSVQEIAPMNKEPPIHQQQNHQNLRPVPIMMNNNNPRMPARYMYPQASMNHQYQRVTESQSRMIPQQYSMPYNNINMSSMNMNIRQPSTYDSYRPVGNNQFPPQHQMKTWNNIRR